MNTDISRPNIFDYATRELSQDAVLFFKFAIKVSISKI